jgi:hypothetical protein
VVQDPAFYIAFVQAKTDPVRLSDGAPKSCKVHIGKDSDSSEDAQRLAKAFAQLANPVSAAQAVSIVCGTEASAKRP